MDNPDHILIVDDDREIRELAGNFLKKNGLNVTLAADGRQMRNLLETLTVDLIVLDIMMPGDDGLVLCRELRAGKHRRTPILLLTARDEDMDRVLGLEMGADDYLVKPFALAELAARVKALLHRASGAGAARVLRVGDLTLDTGTLALARAGQALRLPPSPLQLLMLLMRASPAVVHRGRLEEALWRDSPPDSDSLRTHIHQIRQVVDKPFDAPLLHTVHGIGYQLRAAGDA